VANQTAANNASRLEFDANESANCVNNPPCHQFSNDQKTWQSDGQFNETLSNVMFITGAGVAVTAGVLWYLDIKRNKGQERQETDFNSKKVPEEDAALPSHYIAPVVTGDFIGGAAGLRF